MPPPQRTRGVLKPGPWFSSASRPQLGSMLPRPPSRRRMWIFAELGKQALGHPYSTINASLSVSHWEADTANVRDGGVRTFA